MDAPGPDRDHQQPRAPSSRLDVLRSVDFRVSSLFVRGGSGNIPVAILQTPNIRQRFFEESPMDHASYCLRIGILLKFRS
jgi:hypothetical protein